MQEFIEIFKITGFWPALTIIAVLMVYRQMNAIISDLKHDLAAERLLRENSEKRNIDSLKETQLLYVEVNKKQYEQAAEQIKAIYDLRMEMRAGAARLRKALQREFKREGKQ